MIDEQIRLVHAVVTSMSSEVTQCLYMGVYVRDDITAFQSSHPLSFLSQYVFFSAIPAATERRQVHTLYICSFVTMKMIKYVILTIGSEPYLIFHHFKPS